MQLFSFHLTSNFYIYFLQQYFSSQSEVFLETQHSNNDVERKSSNMAKFLISYVSHVYIQMKIHTLLTYICLAQRWKPTSICENTI